ncbi:hypothetical protein [uncultured Alteromonas sp.]|jgi:hypothetical protein|uniref:hypothetical protein n=1 Tax=uncultured Alteromonas sp. TaxID=179113 RepID=UPI0025DB126C|nr:hypothetical protein [uncultured Alteromonas sp.]
MTISKVDLINELKASLTSTTKVLDDFDQSGVYDEIVKAAVTALTALSPATSVDTIKLQANVQVYEAPADLWSYKETTWGMQQPVEPWDPGFISLLPTVQSSNGHIFFNFAPTAAMLASLGSSFTYLYFKLYSIDESDNINVESNKFTLLLLLCQCEAMKVLMLREPSIQVTAKTGLSNLRRGDPGNVYRQLLGDAKELARKL